jgi:cytochrome c biogenesis protein CcdA
MKQPTFFEGVVVALVASVAGSVLFTALTSLFAAGAVLRLLIAGLGLGYIVYLFSRSRERIGRLTALGFWAIAAGATWWLAPSLPLYLLVHLGLIWLIRSLYFYSSLLSAFADLGLGGLGLAAALSASTHTNSLFLGIWCFFLLQALFVAIPARLDRKSSQRRPAPDREDRFQRAHRAAETAVRKLSTIR